jgi:renalase
MAKIAVIGAGVTGSLLAHKLSQNGHTVTVLEKSRGRGGRCTTKRTDWGQFDMGAPLIRTRDQQTINLLDELESAGVARRWHVSVADCYHQDGTAVKVQLHSTDDRFYVFTPGMNAACRYWLRGSRLITQARIAHLQQTTAGWLLWDQQQGKYGAFDWVVVTAPWPQTRPLLAEYCADLAPQAESDWLTCRAVAMQFAQPVIDRPELLYWHNSPLQLLVCDSAKPGRQQQSGQIWVAHFSHTPSTDDKNSLDETWSEFAHAQMAAAFGQANVKPVNSYQHYWRYARLSHQGKRPGILPEPGLRLAAAGDWSFGGSIPSAIKAASGLYSQLAQIL